MKIISNLFIFSLSTLLFISCGSDDNMDIPTDDDMGVTLEEERALTITNLTGDETKLWKIGSASLTNSNGTFDISNQYNIVDDEFLFAGDANGGTLTWSPGYDINLDANSISSTAVDYYLPPTEYIFEFNEDSPNEITSIEGQFIFTVANDQTISGTITFASRSVAGEELTLTLDPKNSEDFTIPPANGLNFQEVTSLDISGDSANIFAESAAGIIGSYADNSLFVVARGLDATSETSEIIYKYNIDNQTWSTNYYNQSQFVTKRLNIINNELIAFGGQIVSTYPLTPNGAPTSEFTHNLAYTRFGFGVQGDFGYVVEGSVEPAPLPPSKILKYNYLTNAITEIGVLPKARLYGGVEIYNDNLYIFGGRNEFIGEEFDAECFIFNLQTGASSSFLMPEAPRMSFAAKNGSLIYVGYVVASTNAIEFGVYDTATDIFTPIIDNLDDVGTIEGITVFNGSLYAIYGNGTGDNIMRIFRAAI